jgi:hypothetical protein
LTSRQPDHFSENHYVNYLGKIGETLPPLEPILEAFFGHLLCKVEFVQILLGLGAYMVDISSTRPVFEDQLHRLCWKTMCDRFAGGSVS